MDLPDCPLKDLQDEGTGPVPGDGPIPATIMIVGEAPGAAEAAVSYTHLTLPTIYSV